MILAGLPSAIAWRLATLAWPIINDRLNYWAWCSPRTGMIGTCQSRRGRCATCNRTTHAEHTAAMNQVRDELKRQTDIARRMAEQ